LQEAFALFDRFDAARAYQVGLTNRIVSNGRKIEKARKPPSWRRSHWR